VFFIKLVLNRIESIFSAHSPALIQIQSSVVVRYSCRGIWPRSSVLNLAVITAGGVDKVELSSCRQDSDSVISVYDCINTGCGASFVNQRRSRVWRNITMFCYSSAVVTTVNMSIPACWAATAT